MHSTVTEVRIETQVAGVGAEASFRTGSALLLVADRRVN